MNSKPESSEVMNFKPEITEFKNWKQKQSMISWIVSSKLGEVKSCIQNQRFVNLWIQKTNIGSLIAAARVASKMRALWHK